MEMITDYMLKFNLISPECFKELFIKWNLTNRACAAPLMAKCMGVLIIFGSSLVKLPQVLKIVASGSAEGISLLGVILELFAITCNGVYSYAMDFPITAYGEAVFLSLQTGLIAFIVTKYEKGTLTSLIFALLYGAGIYCSVSFLTPALLWYGQASNIPIGSAGKLIQAFNNYKNGHTGQLSALTIFLLTIGSLVRVLTSMQETGDFIIVATYATATLINSILAAQILYYWNVRPKKLSSKKKRN